MPRRAVVPLSSIAAGVLIEVGYAASGAHVGAVLTVLLMVSAAALVTGALIGFLFGIPRVASEATPAASTAGGTGATTGPSRYLANTNLEQISDWLTKLLVGAGLAQASTIATHLRALVQSIAAKLDVTASAAPFVGSMLAFFVVNGFIDGWLTTRLLLVSAMSRADTQALNLFIDAEEARRNGDLARADDLRSEALQYARSDVDALTERYDQTRGLPRGPLRTAEMESIVSAARQAARSPGWTSEEVRRRFTDGNAGDRVFALGLMQGDTGLADFTVVLDALTSSRSGFEQYQGLVLARMIQAGLEPEQRQQLRDMVIEQLAAERRIRPYGSRWAVARSLLDGIDPGS